MKPYVIRFGLYSGITLVILGLINWFVIGPSLGYRLSEVFGYLSFIVALLAVPMAIKYFREKLNDGSVSFGNGFKIGLGVSLITSVVMFFYSFLFFALVGDEFFEHYMESVPAEELAEIQQQYAEMPEFFSEPWFQGILMGVTVFFIGLIISIISALILRREPA
jgi:hypothetical protein